MSTTFTQEQVDLLRDSQEVEIETALPDGPVHRVIIWVVVEDGEVLVRSYLGAGARWFREATRTGRAALHVASRRIPVRVIDATDEAAIERCSRGLARKYTRSASLAAMLREDVLETTLRLEPA